PRRTGLAVRRVRVHPPVGALGAGRLQGHRRAGPGAGTQPVPAGPGQPVQRGDGPGRRRLLRRRRQPGAAPAARGQLRGRPVHPGRAPCPDAAAAAGQEPGRLARGLRRAHPGQRAGPAGQRGGRGDGPGAARAARRDRELHRLPADPGDAGPGGLRRTRMTTPPAAGPNGTSPDWAADPPTAPFANGSYTGLHSSGQQSFGQPDTGTGRPGRRRRRAGSLRLVWVYPDLLSTYGDRGNLLVLKRRARLRGIEVECIEVNADEQIPRNGDIYLLGGGEDLPQILAARRLRADGGLTEVAARGAVIFAVCAGYQLVGTEFG